MQFDKNFIKKTKKIDTPCVIYSLKKLKTNFREITAAFRGIDIHYAMKANPNRGIIKTLKELGSGFEVASTTETKQLLQQKVDPSRIICMHPIKSPEFLEFLAQNNILILAVDSYEEVDKISKYFPKAKLVVRVTVDNRGSGWPLTGKFGLEVTELPNILKHIKLRKLIPYGLTFHVGSQCFDEANWLKALFICNDVWNRAKSIDVHLQFLSLGGGLAVEYNKPIPSTAKIGSLIHQEINRNFSSRYNVKFSIEPGRAMVADTAILITKVFGITTRDNKNWAYIETGTYNGLIEAIETDDRQFYPLRVASNNRKTKTYNIGGPTCVSLDTPFVDVQLPELKLGERLYILNTGAYLNTCSAPFNGFIIPKEYFWENI